MTFWSCNKNDVIRNTWLISKFMTSQPGSRTIAHIAQYFMKQRQPDNETWSVNRI